MHSAEPPPPGATIAPALMGTVLGAALQLQQARLWPAAIYVVATLLAPLLLVTVARAATRWWRLPAVLACTALLSAGLAGWRASVYAEGALAPELEGRDLLVTGIVTAMPQRTEAGLRFRFDVEAAQLAGAPVRLPPRILLAWYGGEGAVLPPPDLRPGQRWQWQVRLKAPHGHVNPHGFDYELWLWEQGLQATGYVRTGARDARPVLLARTWRHSVEQARHRVRAAIFARVADPGQAGVLAALAVGDQGAIERSDWDVFRATGVAHLMSISGLHVTMFAWAAAALVGTLWRRSPRLCLAWPAQHAALVGGVLLAVAYALFSGWGVPAQRTVLMLAVAAWLRLQAREWPWPWVWMLACAAVVLADPWALAQAGFWLSFVAVGVLFAGGRNVAQVEPPRSRWRRVLRAGGALVREQWIVTLALTPLTLLLFQQVSLVGLAANLLAIPWVTLVVTPLALLGAAAPPLWSLAAHAVEGLAVVLRVLAALPFATWSAPAPPLWAAFAGVLGGLLLVLPAPWAGRVLGLPLLLPVLLWQAPRPPPGEFEVVAADVGQGNAVLVRTATRTLLYDAGPGYSRETDAGQRVLVPLLRAGGDAVHTLVLSHRDSDHTGGAAAVLRMQPGARLVSSLEAEHPLHALRPSQPCAAGQAWTWDGVRFEVLHPPGAAAGGRTKPNALSCVLRVGNGRAHALLAGDIERPQEAALAAAPPGVLAADLLLVPHHGSKTSSSDAFLDGVAPAVALVQAGYRNRFGHPAPQVLQRFAARGIPVFASARCGAATWDSRAPRRVRCARRELARYWHHFAAADDRSGA